MAEENKNQKTIKKLVTHNGTFHADDVFACALLTMMLRGQGENFEVVRTRDPDVVASGDYVFDVGGVYDEEKNKFDHHQPGGAGKRGGAFGKSGIPYSSFGLVWKKFGLGIAGSEKAFEMIDRHIVTPIDAWDNGIELVENKYEVVPYVVQHFMFNMNPTWREEDLSSDDMFVDAFDLARDIFSREIIQVQDTLLAEEFVKGFYESAKDKRITVIGKNYPYQETLQDFSEPLFVVYPKENNFWGVKTVRDEMTTFKNRKDLPKSWAGLRDAELQNITGVADAVFCHKELFIAAAGSKEGAVKLAELALQL